MRWPMMAMAVCALSAGCDASFEDLRSAEERAPVTPESPPAPQADPPGESLAEGPGEGSEGEGGEDETPAEDIVVARGTWEGRSDYAAGGEVLLIQRADGNYEFELSDDFRTADLPGPTLVISSRESLGSSLSAAAGDIEITRLDRVTGAQIHEIPTDPEGRRVAWVYCKPFGIEMARAILEEVE
ncbi:MAG: hypothetical protein ACE366_19515 [Bradymonadia bacterium]